MVTIVRDRIREYVKRGMTLDQVKAKKPTLDFDPPLRHRRPASGPPAMFIETIYKEMVGQESAGARRPRRAAEPEPDQEPGAANERRGQVDVGARRTAGGRRCVGVLAFGAGSDVRRATRSAASTPQVADQQGRQTPGAQGAARPRPRAGGAASARPRQTAPVDLTGNWVSVVTEDWQWRMLTPAKGDYASVPLTPAGRARRGHVDRGQGRPVRGVRRRRPDAHAGPPAHQLAGRQHAEDRNRRRPADAAAAFRAAGPARRRAPVTRARARGRCRARRWPSGSARGGAFDAFLERGGGARRPASAGDR